MIFIKHRLRRSLFGCGSRWGRGRFGTDAARSAERRANMVERGADALRLDAEQKPLLASLLEQMYTLRQTMTGTTTDWRAELRSWFGGATFDANRAQALLDDKAATLQQASPNVVAALADFFDSLNPAQQQKLRDLMEGRRSWFGR